MAVEHVAQCAYMTCYICTAAVRVTQLTHENKGFESMHYFEDEHGHK